MFEMMNVYMHWGWMTGKKSIRPPDKPPGKPPKKKKKKKKKDK